MPPEEKAAPKLQEHMANLALSSIAQIRNKKKLSMKFSISKLRWEKTVNKISEH